ncbi:MAG TPA: hypothetical protein VM286_05560 [Candidatus Thermoplasmatota archaeon]|nr:hypothetical protein [Candidatus Thermoplasmatota archaeon]
MARPAVDTGLQTLDSGTVLGHLAVGLLGASLLALAPSLDPSGGGFQYLPEYAAVTGLLLVGWAATLRMHALLAVLAFVLSLAAFASTVAGPGHVDVQRSAIGLLCASAIVMGAAVRGPWVFPLFLFAPLAIEQVATGTWNLGRADFSAQWASAIGCDCPVAGFPAALAVLGGLVGRAVASPMPVPRPSALAPLLGCFCVLVTAAVAYTVLPASLDFWRTTAVQAMVMGGALGWVLLSYQLGTPWSVLDGFLACFLILAGIAYAGHELASVFSLSDGLAIAFVVSLVPAALAGVGILMRMWLGRGRHRTLEQILARRPAAKEGDAPAIPR